MRSIFVSFYVLWWCKTYSVLALPDTNGPQDTFSVLLLT